MTKILVQNGLMKRNQNHARRNFSCQVLGRPGSASSAYRDSGKIVVYIKIATIPSTSTALIRLAVSLRILTVLLRTVAIESY